VEVFGFDGLIVYFWDPGVREMGGADVGKTAFLSGSHRWEVELLIIESGHGLPCWVRHVSRRTVNPRILSMK